mmetsp:Transcript_14824/g.21657  ORF Transcript_14824/g.21657 Transcript_14824/m.21657 type:complete len:138 (-) Transcript_14824:645-1058(-)
MREFKKSDFSSLNTELDDGVFLKCSKLIGAKLPEHLPVLVKSIFAHCSLLTLVRVPLNATKIEGETIFNGTFENCTSLLLVEIPESCAAIGVKAFQSCKSLVSVALPTTCPIDAVDESSDDNDSDSRHHPFSGCTKL